MTTRAERIEAGVAFLDVVHGKEWPSLINLEELDLSHHERCIIGELDGDFINRFKTNDELEEAVSLGLFLPEVPYNLNWTEHYLKVQRQRTAYEHLTTAWARVVRKLRKERGL